ncbi:unnamed protein product [Penicillium salamii]|uniref:Transcription factor 25 n=1 Tax=Penicillium salamii TaxID=1612424 RepID=A0A9W4I696_9EURO|nr:unnamed protein product [Penicillium salamii]CAG8043459.1 unnamed protein product [Penicillium salamii]CAG8063485.1 unnamed protein product [Penicillium salamii]CAG8195970.1 unnamed protein product [Penicillium salamii]CAG8212696.1 unnamed protein product [Penicillium salamii]
MSSRAIRKLQRLREQEQQVSDSRDESSEDEAPRPAKPKFNAFDLLNAGDDGDNDDQEEEEEDDTEQPQEEPTVQPSKPEPAPKSKSSRKKKKNKKASKASVPASRTPEKSNEELDEIDKALNALSVNKHNPFGPRQPTASSTPPEETFPMTTNEVLGIESKYLNATNEMRRLFGNVVLENFDQPADAGAGRRRDRNRQMIDLAQALTGKYSPASRGLSLAGVTQRKNFLMQGRDDWPRAPSGGLSMEFLQKFRTGETLFKLIHNTAYEDVQRQFDLCVESMDPQRMIGHLQYNPYHISTLLQVSEIAKHQGDHAVSADLMERALFNIGRSVHSSFSDCLKYGEARIDFIHDENREFFLVGWRYISNLGMKGTWRTAYEWSKLLLSVNDTDPYCMKLLIDHLALRGREYAHFVQMCTQTRFSRDWADLPNIQCSLVMAYLRLNKPKECREQLQRVMSRYPWVFSRLAQELDLKHVPKAIWGKMPPTGSHELLTELYIARAKDLWNTPEVVALIMEVADSITGEVEPIEPPEITLAIARHVVVSDIPKVTTYLPNHFVAGRLSSSDPLPPPESDAYERQSEPQPMYAAPAGAGGENWLQDLLGQLNNRNPGAGDIDDEGPFIRGFDDEDGNENENENQGTNAAEDNYDIPTSRPPLGDRAALEGWLSREGLQTLRIFLSQYGVDRGNWGEVVVNYAPLTNYLQALDGITEASRRRLLEGTIKDSLGDFAVSMLEDEYANMRE